jgi:hypothetical protein
MELSTAGTNLSRFIGALEIGRAPAFDDGALEAAGPSPHMPPTVLPPCRHIDDGALEAAGPNPGGLPPTILPPCRHIDDGALETAANTVANAQPMTTRHVQGLPGCI